MQAGGLAAPLMQRLLREANPPALLVDALSLVSYYARIHKDTLNTYEPISKSGVVPLLRRLLGHGEPGVRARVCNLIGNMCRHSGYFYGALERHGVLPPLIERCGDPDKGTRKFACFAIGNAGFHSAALYEALRPAVGPLVALLGAEEEKTRANAAGALGNLVRNGAMLCGELLQVGGVLSVVMGQARHIAFLVVMVVVGDDSHGLCCGLHPATAGCHDHVLLQTHVKRKVMSHDEGGVGNPM
jgi:fused-like protein